jgi:mono/diheme cytochrome c family protein
MRLPRSARLAILAALVASAAGAQQYTPRVNYILHCAGCHGMTGEGSQVGGIPAFPHSVAYIASIDAGRTYMMHVPGVVSAGLSDAQIAEVTNYILAEWSDGAAFTPFDAAEVTRRRAVPVSNVVEYRREVAGELAAQGIELAYYPWP